MVPSCDVSCNFTEEPSDAVKQKMLLFCRILRAFLKCEEQTGPFKRTRYFKLVTAEEESLGTRQETAAEYAIFLKCLRISISWSLCGLRRKSHRLTRWGMWQVSTMWQCTLQDS